VSRLRCLDLFCGAGGATRGLQRAGYHVTGVDIRPQPRYCGDAFVRADALRYPLRGYDLIWASPPCQHYCLLGYKNGNAAEHQALITPVRHRLQRAGVPWVIENVAGARRAMRDPVMLCGTMFGLGIPKAQLWRHRLFDSSEPLEVALSCHHRGSPVGVYGGGDDNRRFGILTVTGHSGGIRKRGNLQQYNVRERSRAMGIDWMTNAELSQAIPPAYSEYIARQIRRWGL
jgi:DNA (cytosine-5)-methyltransferase 1